MYRADKNRFASHEQLVCYDFDRNFNVIDSLNQNITRWEFLITSKQ